MTNDNIFLPDHFLRSVLPKGFWTRTLLTREGDPKAAMKKAIVTATILSNRELTSTYTSVISQYEDKMAKLKAEGIRAYKSTALNGESLLRNRITGLIIYNEVQEQKKQNKGRRYRWLPSSALEPDPEHQLLYGQIFNEGEGDGEGNMPGERYGCQCGIEWLPD